MAITPIHRLVRGSMSGREKEPELSKRECDTIWNRALDQAIGEIF